MRQKILPLLLATIVIPAFAQETAKSPDLHSTLKQVAQQAVLQSPEVTTGRPRKKSGLLVVDSSRVSI